MSALSLGEAVMLARKRRKVSQAQLAAALGRERRVVMDVEGGMRMLDEWEYRRVDGFLGGLVTKLRSLQ